MELESAHREILLHASGLNRAEEMTRDYYICPAGDPTVEALVASGHLVSCGARAWLCGDTTYRLTERGRAAALASRPPAPKLTRSQKRYQAWLRAESGLRFDQWFRLPRGERSGP